ncbi:MAG TPA: M14 family metallopeptidase [Candidatus Polarisedimenticolia bacterium]|nr:M14 family metallopeptidase [Candidatus Polarisedimenticolia bacterium]
MKPQTRAEATSYRETSLHADVVRYLSDLAARADKRLHISSFGQSPGGRDLPLVVASAHGARTPEEARGLGLPIVLIINGIHAGEVEGKEASMMLLRDLLDGTRTGLLDRLTLVVVPLFNPDGNDALDPKNRRLDLANLDGQVGPALVGTRVNAAGINLNRDYLRQAAPEMRALQARVVQVWDPDLTIDTHATNGSVHRLAMTYDIPHTSEAGRPEPIEFMRTRVMPPVTAALARDHGLLAGWYGNFVEDERALDARRPADPAQPVTEGWMTYPHHPRFGSNYRGLGGRLDLLLECYSYLPFPDRVRTTYATLLETLAFVAAHPDDVLQVVEASRAPRDRIAVRARLEAFPGTIEIPTRVPRTLEGAPTSVTVRHLARYVGTTVVARPRGYIVPTAAGAHLARHGLRTEAAIGTHEVEIATVTRVGAETGRKILEASEFGDLSVEWRRATRAAPAGSLLVHTDDSRAAIAVYLCEPESDDGPIENGLVPMPSVGDEFPIWRVPA